jgi:hypothetical protein
MPQPPTEHHELVESLKQFLTAQSAAPMQAQHCSECGGPIRYLQTQFWLMGEEQGWNVGLPYCPHCQAIPNKKVTLAA